MYKGILRKINVRHVSPVEYTLKMGEANLSLNDYVGQKVKLSHTGRKYCIDTGKKSKKLYGQGYSFESFITLPQCDTCIIKPELCHYKQGTCRDPQWGENHCLKPHVIYISLTSSVKVGITRKTQVPTRWIDQGAVKAIKLCEVKDRLTSGIIEVEIAKELGDKTNWRNMLKNKYEDVDLKKIKADVVTKFADILNKHQVIISDDEIIQ